MGNEERRSIFENIARLRRVEKTTPSADIASVREDLESQLGWTLSRSLAASLLGVSHTALNNWVASGDIPVVITQRGRKEVPISVLLDLLERVEEERRSGRRGLHVLERAMTESRGRAERIRPEAMLPPCPRSDDPHRGPQLRSLVYHRALAPRLRRPMIDEARRKLSRRREEGRIDPRYARAWEEVLTMPVARVREVITADDERGRTLRQSSPLAGLLSEPERRRILEVV